jgi:hypothetical protein
LLANLTSTLACNSIAHAGHNTANRRFSNGRSADCNACHLSQSHSIHHLSRDHGRHTTTTPSTARARAPAQLQQKSHVNRLAPGLSLKTTKLSLPGLPHTQWSATSHIPPSIPCTTVHRPSRLPAPQHQAQNGAKAADYQNRRTAPGVAVALAHGVAEVVWNLCPAPVLAM